MRARVVAGRLVLEEPVELPEGTVIDLMPADDGDDLDDAERARLHDALRRGGDELAAGRGVPVEEALRRIGGDASR
jgi:hypothetical protein